MPDLPTLLGGAGGAALLTFILGGLKRSIDNKVPLEVHAAVCKNLSKSIEDLKEDQKRTTEVVGDIRVMVARIETKLEG